MKKWQEFTNEDIEYIIKNWGKESTYIMKDKLECSRYAVCKVAELHGLQIPKTNFWTKEEEDKLRQLASKYYHTDIAVIMNRTDNAICSKAKKLGIKLIPYEARWTKEEEELLSDLWGYKSVEYISNKLNRNVSAVKEKAYKLGLGSMINNNYDVITLSDLCKLLNVSYIKVVNTWVNLGLKLKRKKLSDSKSYVVIYLKDLIDFLEKNQNEWDSEYLEKNILGPEPNWLKEKRIKDSTEKTSFRRMWTDEEIQKVEQLYKNGMSYLQISKEVNRTKNAVGILLRKMGYTYTLPNFWTEEETEYLKNNYENMTYQDIADSLGKTHSSVSHKVIRMGFKRR